LGGRESRGANALPIFLCLKIFFATELKRGKGEINVFLNGLF
jgi:hypothetical protein